MCGKFWPPLSMAEQLCGQQKLLVSCFHFLFSVCHYVGPFFTSWRFHGQQLVDRYFNCESFSQADPVSNYSERDVIFRYSILLYILSLYPVCWCETFQDFMTYVMFSQMEVIKQSWDQVLLLSISYKHSFHLWVSFSLADLWVMCVFTLMSFH